MKGKSILGNKGIEGMKEQSEFMGGRGVQFQACLRYVSSNTGYLDWDNWLLYGILKCLDNLSRALNTALRVSSSF